MSKAVWIYMPHGPYDGPVDLERCRVMVSRSRCHLGQCARTPKVTRHKAGFCSQHDPGPKWVPTEHERKRISQERFNG